MSSPITELYSSARLKSISLAVHKMRLGESGDIEFSKFQRETLNSVFREFYYDFSSISILGFSDSLVPQIKMSSGLDLSPSIVSSYESMAELDQFTPIAMENPGSAITKIDIMSNDEWQDSDFYRKHCKVYDISDAIMVYFTFPHNQSSFIGIEYLASEDNHSFANVDARQIEWATFPFALAWLCRYGIIGFEEFEQCIELLANNNERALNYLLTYIHNRELTFDQIADHMSVSSRAVKKQIYGIRERATEVMWSKFGLTREITMREFDAAFQFLKMIRKRQSSTLQDSNENAINFL